jgi:3-keto-disaccharide hydrolase
MKVILPKTRVLLLGLSLTACVRAAQVSSPRAAAPNTLTASERAAGWQLLFDGKTFKGWHALGFAEMPNGLWIVEDGAIKHVEKGAGPKQADGQPLAGWDLVSDSAFRDYELSWEWKISEAGNSGLKYNVSEQLSITMAPKHAAKGWEYQMNDDVKNEDNKIATHLSGALYEMFPANDKKRVNPAGQWNRSTIVFRGNHGEHWLNGQRIVEFDIGTPAFDSAFAKSKYSKYPAWFPERRKGQIVLQDHDDVVWFRDIKIRVIK